MRLARNVAIPLVLFVVSLLAPRFMGVHTAVTDTLTLVSLLWALVAFVWGCAQLGRDVAIPAVLFGVSFLASALVRQYRGLTMLLTLVTLGWTLWSWLGARRGRDSLAG